ncbi:MAG: cytidylate kinase-like family protein, partial [Geodermatophilaceae bacterium]
MGIVTISASYGALGGQVGPEVAETLGLPFIDRAIPASVAHKLGVSLDDAEAKDETVASGLWRAISSMALVPDLSGAGPLASMPVPDERAFREKTEQVLREVANSTGGVILGRAGAVVLADVPDALHVRLDGPPQA